MLDYCKRIITIVFILSSFYALGQNEERITEKSSTKNNFFKNQQNFNTWAVGVGFSNLIMHGDFRSLGTENGKNFINIGGYFYANKMFNPILGVEVKLNISQLGASGQFLSDVYEILYAEAYKGESLHMEGISYGMESSLILNLDNIWRRQSEKWSFSAYLGMGYQRYTSKLIVTEKGKVIEGANFETNGNRPNGDHASSIYLNTGLGVKYRLNKKFDLELRTTLNLNNEDHLDAAISRKQNYETFFVTNIGVVYKFGEKKKYAIWINEEDEKDPSELVDSDNDGVEDLFDKEPETPEGAEVYGSGIAIDSDKDGLQDYKDKCPLKPGPIENEGCPIPVVEEVIEEPEVEEEPEVQFNEEEKQRIIKQIALLSKSIYFKTASDKLKEESYKPLNEISGIMNEYPQSKYKIEGHTDSRGKAAYNLDLSKRRAKSVSNYLTGKNIDAVRIPSEGFGEEKPVKTNETEAGRQFNRRVEINFIDPDSVEGRLVYDKGVSFTEEIVVSGGLDTNLSSKLMTLDISKLTNVTVDTDGDGVTDLYDKEPDTPEGVRVYGDGVSVDSDADGIADYKDDCPFAKGTVERNGCPEGNETISSDINTSVDSDGDGVTDLYDKEPDTPQGARVYGDGVSVDSDADGIADYIDECPFVKGTVERNGCTERNEVVSSGANSTVDTDGDGVTDLYDKEPDTPQGARVYGDGVSVDSDADGIADYKDECPFAKGSVERNGCPEIDEIISLDINATVDTDGDGVTDLYDKEPNTPVDVKVYGDGVSVDSDTDGIPDYKDECPFIKGSIENNGCSDLENIDKETNLSQNFVDTDGDGVIDLYDKEPNTSKESRVYGDGVSVDSDRDGIADYKDDCPFAKGAVANNGCPIGGVKSKDEDNKQELNVEAKDTDGDGVADVFDKEPNTPPNVKVYNNGVSFDSDKDGVPDYKDRCPLIKGKVSNNGCPEDEDLDGDGVVDSKDFCPDVKGSAKNNGCPEQVLTSSVGDQLNQLVSKIQFARSEGHVLKSNNLAVLDQIADVMLDFKATKFIIEIHTSNKPNLKYNLDLSKRRAFAIKKYLVKVKEISENRLEVIGLGGSQLKYDTDNKVENAKNNRVVMKFN